MRIQRQVDRAREQVQGAVATAVTRIAEHGGAERRTVDANLVGAAGFWADLEPCQLGRSAHHPPVRHGRLASGVDHHPPTARTGLTPQRCLDPARLACDLAVDHRPVDLARRSACEASLRGMERCPPQCHNQAAGSIGIQPVRQPWPILPA